MDDPMGREAKHAVEDAVSQARNMKDKAETSLQDIRRQAEDFQSQVIASARDKPIQTLAIAAFVGLALGALLKK